MTNTATATAKTDHAARYLQQLAMHWSHKARVNMTPQVATIAFPNGDHLALQASANRLTLQVFAHDDGHLPQFREVIEKHILRFAFREELTFSWT